MPDEVVTSTTPQARKPSIAVIVPNRNDARYLPRCISSILDQEVPPDELIVVDDQSTDNSVAVIRSLIANRPGIQLIENPANLGVYGALDEGLKRTRSEYVLFLASNDFVLPGIFAHAKACLAKYPGVGLWSAMGWLVDEDDQPICRHDSPVIALSDAGFTPEQCRRLAWRFGNWFTGTTLIYHRDTLNEMGRFDPAYKGLADLIAALIVASKRGAAYSPEPLAVVRIHKGSHISNTLGNAAGIEAMLERLREHGPRLAPQLFTPAFLDRMALRFRLAVVQTSYTRRIDSVAERYTGWRHHTLTWTDRFVPLKFWRTRFRLARVILSPFDILPRLWNRLISWTIVMMRFRHTVIHLKHSGRE